MAAPLEGIRVVEIASFVAVPGAGALLADLGADVVKVEVPWGEIYRHSVPRMAGFQSDFPGAPHFHMDNRGKRSLALDLALPQAVEALAKVADRADVVLTNLLPERQKKYGLDPETLHAKHPGLVIARLSGYGPEGEEANAPAFDYSAYWARTGPDGPAPRAGRPPGVPAPGHGRPLGQPVPGGGHPLAPCAPGTRDGKGQVIDVSLQHIGFYIEGNDAAVSLVTGAVAAAPRPPARRATRSGTTTSCGDGRWLFLVMIESDRYWPAFTEAIEPARPGRRRALRERGTALPATRGS